MSENEKKLREKINKSKEEITYRIESIFNETIEYHIKKYKHLNVDSNLKEAQTKGIIEEKDTQLATEYFLENNKDFILRNVLRRINSYLGVYEYDLNEEIEQKYISLEDIIEYNNTSEKNEHNQTYLDIKNWINIVRHC